MGTTSLENYGTLEEQSDSFLFEGSQRTVIGNKKTEELTEDQRQLRRAIGIFMNRVDEVNPTNKLPQLFTAPTTGPFFVPVKSLAWGKRPA